MKEGQKLELLEECPICGSSKHKKDIEVTDLAYTKDKFQIVRCENCNFVFTNPRPTEKSIIRYYQSNDYISHSDDRKGLINKVYYIVKQKNLKNKLSLINSIHSKGKLLDIGCGTGSFLEVCKENEWMVAGIEPDRKARELAIQKTEGMVSESLLELDQTLTFDVITMWHVLEHIHKLNESLNLIRKKLKKEGKLIIAVPNIESYDATFFKENWAAYDVPRHLYHFDQNTIIKLLKKHHFKIEKILPMKYDAYYISLMSYKYTTNKLQYFSGFLTGYKSNEKAKKNNNYSSLTYIFSKEN